MTTFSNLLVQSQFQILQNALTRIQNLAFFRVQTLCLPVPWFLLLRLLISCALLQKSGSYDVSCYFIVHQESDAQFIQAPKHMQVVGLVDILDWTISSRCHLKLLSLHARHLRFVKCKRRTISQQDTAVFL
jgi:hypothetical protein